MIRYKILTLGQIKEKRERLGRKGKVVHDTWNDGERVFAFEDGAVSFSSGGGFLWHELEDPEEIAVWTDALDRLGEKWSRRAEAA